MKKKTLLAIVLSFSILIIYSFFVPQSRVKDGQYKAQPAHNKQFPILLDEKNIFENDDSTIEMFKNKQKFVTLETDNFLLNFSTRGGVLENIFLQKYNYSFPVKNIFLLGETERQVFSVEKIEKNKVIFSFENSDFLIRKIYEVGNDFTIKVKILFLDKNKMSKIKKHIIGFQLNPPNLDDKSIVPSKNYLSERTLYEYVVVTSDGIFRKDNANLFDSKYLREFNDKVHWFGFRDRYYCFIIKNTKFINNLYVNPEKKYILNLSFDFNPEALPSLNEPQVLDSIIFAGPQDSQILKSVDESFPQILNFKIGGFMDFLTLGTTDIITKVIVHFLNFTYKYTKNWGVSIIVLSFSIFLMTYPLTVKSMLSMKKMQFLQPEIAKIREQFKNNPEKINREMMNLYKSHKFNPFGGCLPMFLQMPIFVSLYQVLWRSFNFKGAHFLWIKDLSEADRVILLNFSVPFLGNEINILPFFVIFFMFLQQKFSSKSLPGGDSSQQAQQKTMALLMPITIGILFYKVASGLCLYFTVFYFLSTIMQWKMSKVK